MEAYLRILSIIFLVLTACLVRFDTETKVVFFSIARKATFRDMSALYDIVWIDIAAAVYNLLQLLRCFFLPGPKKNGVAVVAPSQRYIAWGIYFLDQATVYVVFAAHTAALQASMLGLTGEEVFQWMKICDKYTRFCHQIGGALMCGYIATFLMAVTSSISAYVVFRNYSPRHFLRVKGT